MKPTELSQTSKQERVKITVERRPKEERLLASIEAVHRVRSRRRLSNEDIRGIRLGSLEGITQTALASIYSTSQGYISDILAGKRRKVKELK